MATAFHRFALLAARHPWLYLSCCFAVGLTIRFWMAGGNWGLFVNPLFPLFIH